MSDILIRGVSEEVVAAIDSHAVSLGLSRNEFLRRSLGQVAHRNARHVTIGDFSNFASLAADLEDPEIMKNAWS